MAEPVFERTFRGHRNAVTGACFHPSLTQVASSSADGCVMVWNFKASMRAFRYVGHRGTVTDVAFNNQGSLIASVSADTTLRLWIPTVKAESSVIKAHSAAVRCVNFSHDGSQIVTGSDDKSIKIWSTSTQRFALSFPGHQNWVRDAVLSPDARLCASGGDDKAVFVWDPLSRKATHSFFEHTDSVTCVAFHPDGNTVAAGGADRTINIWDLRMNQLLQHYDQHADVINSISFHPSGNWLLSGSSDATAKIWDLREGLLYCTVKAHEGEVNDARFSPCGTKFVTSGRDGIVMVWGSNLGVDPSKRSAATAADRSAAAGNMSSRYVDPTNTVMSPQHPQPRTASTRQLAGAPTASALTSRSLALIPGGGASAALDAIEPRAAPQPRSASAQAARPTHRSIATVEPELPVEQLMRQVDIGGQTQKILETRVTHSENAHRLLADTVRERDLRVTEQLETLKSQLANVHAESTEQRKDIAILTQTISRQEDLIRSLMEQQRALIAALTQARSDDSA